MIKPSRALVIGVAASAAFAGAAAADAVYYYDSYSGRMVMGYAPDSGTYDRAAPVMQAPAPQVYYYSPPEYRPAPEYRYVPPGLSITTPLGTYAPFYGGWSPYGHENVGGYDHYRLTPDR